MVIQGDAEDNDGAGRKLSANEIRGRILKQNGEIAKWDQWV